MGSARGKLHFAYSDNMGDLFRAMRSIDRLTMSQV
jgi:hypothetical protein